MSYVPIHVHSVNSIRDSILKIDDYINKAKELGLSSIGISEHGIMSSNWSFYKKCINNNIKPILGSELYYTPSLDFKDEIYHLLVIAKNNVGLQNLYRLSTMAYTLGFYKKPRISEEMLFNNSDGLIVCTGCCFGYPQQLLINGQIDSAYSVLDRFRKKFKDDFYLEIHDHDIADEVIVRDYFRSLVLNDGYKAVAATDSHYLNYEDKKIHNIFKQLAYGSIGTEKDDSFNGDRYHIWSIDEVNSRFTKDEIDNTLEIADKTNVHIEHFNYHLPKYDTNGVDKYLYLKDIVYKTLKIKGLNGKKEYEDRLAYELEIIHLANLEDYMLIVYDYVKWCNDNGIPTGPGRGCLTGDTYVLTNNGYKYLKDIVKHDMVYSHTGNLRQVLDTMVYDVSDEELLSIKTKYSFDSIQLTKDHKLYGKLHKLSDQYKTPVRNGIQNTKCKKLEYGDLEWISADKFVPNDILYTPWVDRIEDDIETIRFQDRDIVFDEDFAYLIGRWIGDGWITECHNCILGIAFKKHDTIGIDRISDIVFNKFGYKMRPNLLKDNTVTNLYLYSKDIVELFKGFFTMYKYTTRTKHLGKFKYISDTKLISLLHGLIDSDGRIDIDNTYSREIINTTSKQLALDIKEILLYLRIPSNIVASYSCISVLFKGIKTIKSKNVLSAGYYSKITSISKCKEKYVYDITVENDHSYLTSNYAVHNSMAGSIICYLLNITGIDPIKHNLYFARAINSGRLLQYKFF